MLATHGKTALVWTLIIFGLRVLYVVGMSAMTYRRLFDIVTDYTDDGFRIIVYEVQRIPLKARIQLMRGYTIVHITADHTEVRIS
jgi:hypothetical protein